ncbi:hypothetical protein GCM10009681_39190 [Luedemannella helvata]|uniref:Uncharacterized protein n=1 Tax=Luedemannella helvata TaxID=349315 RepID=A0ABP4WZR8_9ACTN
MSVPAQRAPVAAYQATERVRIGRGAGNDIALADLAVSRRHAELRRVGDAYEVVDLGSSNGIFHNGQRVPRARLTPGDRISIGRHQLIFDGQRLHEFVDTGPVSLAAQDLTVQVGKTVLLDDVSFTLRQGALLAVVGPSGCGKSTLVKAVTGLRPATLGQVQYDGRDLYDNYAELRYRIGMVPQDDVLHRQLTVRRALRYAAALRFADDVPRRERWKRVDEVIHTLDLDGRAKQRIDTLSGGQRKRVSVALELLTEPSLLFLDEPTSGLDPSLDKEVMQELRELADRGRTVVVVTHNVLHLDLCDRVLVMCLGGRMGYFGPPSELLSFFQAKDYADVFTKVTDEGEKWARIFRDSEHYRRYVSEPAAELAQAAAQRAAAPAPTYAPPPAVAPVPPPAPAQAADDAPDVNPTATFTVPPAATSPQPAPPGPAPQVAPPAYPVPPPSAPHQTHPAGAPLGSLPLRARARHPSAPIRQYFTLCLRMLSVIISDRGYALFLLGLPLALALLTHAVPGEFGLAAPPPTVRVSLEAQRLLVVLVVGAAFLGIAVSIREIVNESSIYRRERAAGLLPAAYLASKLTVLGLINIIQVILFVYLSVLGRGGPSQSLVLKPPMVEITVVVALVAITSTVMGLAISALVRTSEQTTPILVVLVMAQLVLSGGLFELQGEKVLQVISTIAPTRWGFAAGASTVDMQKLVPFLKDSLWDPTPSAWWRSVLVMLGQIAILVVAARIAMRRLEPGRQ